MIEVIDLKKDSRESNENVEKKEKKYSLKTNNIEVTNIKDLSISTKLYFNNQTTVPHKI